MKKRVSARKPKGLPGVRPYKPTRRNHLHHKWMVRYKHPVTGAVKIESVSACPSKTEDRVRKLFHWLQEHEDEKRGTINLKARRLRRQADRLMSEHLEEWKLALLAKGVTAKQAGQVYYRATRTLRAVERIDEITPFAVQTALGELRGMDAAGVVRAGPATLNYHLKAAKQFTRWLLREGRIDSDPIQFMEGYNTAVDVRRGRRALTPRQCLRLIVAARRGEPFRGLSGPDRAMLYVVALGTGLRRNELRSLTPASFQLNDDPPTVTVSAACSKHRRLDIQPLDPDLAAQLRLWLADRPPDAILWSISDKSTWMIQRDLKRAKVPYWTDQGYADFHCLRHTFCTRLAAAPIPIRVLQQTMRHSDPRLTMRYAHPTLHDQALALSTLPKLPALKTRHLAVDKSVENPSHPGAKTGLPGASGFQRDVQRAETGTGRGGDGEAVAGRIVNACAAMRNGTPEQKVRAG